ncbi:MAG TPA: penicillin-binding protein 2 [Firmicutes bacterium]|nr:penicillin-binding protein 2 [Bacillota bacterium]
MELNIRKVQLAFITVFIVLGAWLGYWVVFKGEALSNDARNPRHIIAELRIARGRILDIYGNPLVTSVLENNMYRREYSAPLSAAQTIGYMSTRFGKTGLEKAYDTELSGSTRAHRGLLSGLLQPPEAGLDIKTTLDPKLQKAAEEGLAGNSGAVVVLDADDGAILVAASTPYFDPNNMTEDIFQDVKGEPLFNRAFQGRYPPGSAFKPLILAAALETNSVSVNQIFQDNSSYTVDGFTISNFQNSSHGRLDLNGALTYSSNVVFVQVGLATGGAAIRALAERIGMLETPQLPVPAAASHLPSLRDLSSPRAVAQISIGQGEAWVTPLHMAMLAATIANGGYAVQPYLIESVGEQIVKPSVAKNRVISAGVVQYVAEAMRSVVTNGSGRRAAVSGVAVSGKTGTAQNPLGKDHAWFIGFAKVKDRTLAVAAVVENAGQGGHQAAPIVATIIQAAKE